MKVFIEQTKNVFGVHGKILLKLQRISCTILGIRTTSGGEHITLHVAYHKFRRPRGLNSRQMAHVFLHNPTCYTWLVVWVQQTVNGLSGPRVAIHINQVLLAATAYTHAMLLFFPRF